MNQDFWGVQRKESKLLEKLWEKFWGKLLLEDINKTIK